MYELFAEAFNFVWMENIFQVQTRGMSPPNSNEKKNQRQSNENIREKRVTVTLKYRYNRSVTSHYKQYHNYQFTSFVVE